MDILGLNIGHNATASLLTDGRIIGCASEERFSRLKNHTGVPFHSIKYLLKENKLSLKDISLIVLDDYYEVTSKHDFGKKFLEAYTKQGFIKRNLSKIGYKFPNWFRKRSLKKETKRALKRKEFASQIRNKLSKLLRFPENRIITMDHHLAHAFSTCFNISKNKKTLIFTLDGEGSGICASVNIWDGNSLKTISRTRKEASLGYLYAITTIFLGMKPLQHEFKVMGLAPYAKEHNINKVYPQFRNLVQIDNKLRFNSKFNMPFAHHFLNQKMKHVRFDIVAGAVQKLVEEKTTEWISKAIKKTGIKDIALAGGVFMNVKANQKIAELPEVKSLYIMPSCGDESNAIGCCFYGYQLYCKKHNLKLAQKPIKDLYLGPEYDDKYIENLIEKLDLKKKYKITKPKNINSEIAKLLHKEHIVARCSGKSEWGARALGNRSILANPFSPDTVRILNETIKDRDFWMPFTPSMLDTFEKKYVINKKKIHAPYMVITFDSTPLAKKHLPAAMHPYDSTVRPQIVHKSWNPDYHEILSRFKKLSGIGAVLNTSFNLHGEPNVLTPEDALHTIENSDLNYLAMGSYLFAKKSKSGR